MGSAISTIENFSKDIPIKRTMMITSPLVALVNLTKAVENYRKALESGNDKDIASAFLGIAASLSDFLASIPTPQSKAIGTALSLGATGFKTAVDNGLFDPWLKDLDTNRSGKYHVHDPITLDLNNDGITNGILVLDSDGNGKLINRKSL